MEHPIPSRRGKGLPVRQAQGPERVEGRGRGTAPILEGATRSRPYDEGIRVDVSENESALPATAMLALGGWTRVLET